MEAVLFSFGNQKGGAGKTTLTTVFANYVHNNTEYSICVVDADDQQTLSDWRKIDIQINGADEEELYDLHPVHPQEFIKLYTRALIKDYDFVVVDLPGSFKDGVISSYSLADAIFVPVIPSSADILSSLKYIKAYKEKVAPIREKNNFAWKIMGVLNQVDLRTSESRDPEIVTNQFDIPFLKNFMPLSSVFKRNNTTNLDYDLGRNNDKLNGLCQEILDELLEIRKEKNN